MCTRSCPSRAIPQFPHTHCVFTAPPPCVRYSRLTNEALLRLFQTSSAVRMSSHSLAAHLTSPYLSPQSQGSVLLGVQGTTPHSGDNLFWRVLTRVYLPSVTPRKGPRGLETYARMHHNLTTMRACEPRQNHPTVTYGNTSTRWQYVSCIRRGREVGPSRRCIQVGYHQGNHHWTGRSPEDTGAGRCTEPCGAHPIRPAIRQIH